MATIENKQSFWQEHSTLTLAVVLLAMGSAWAAGALMLTQIAKIGTGQ